jgi:hypothetical protein
MRITDFPELIAPTGNDLLVTVDIANDLTKKVKLDNLPISLPTLTALATKQDSLVSGTNIKTLNSVSLLGSGNIVLAATPSGVSGAIQFSNGSAFASDAANLFWDDTNNRLGVGTNAPSVPFEVLGNAWVNAAANADATFSIGNPSRRWDVKALQSGAYYQVAYNNGMIGQSIDFQGNVAFGNVATLGARLGIKGSGSTSATTSLLVQNSAGTAALTVKDDLSTTFGGNVTTPSLTINGNWIANNSNTIFGTAFNYILNPVNIGGTLQTSSAMLEVRSTTRGFLPPVMTTTQKNAIASPAAGLVVYDSTTNKLQCYNGSTWNDLF